MMRKSVAAEMFTCEWEGAGLDGACPMAGGGQEIEAAASCIGSQPQRLPHAVHLTCASFTS